jgi:hypothetical protein
LPLLLHTAFYLPCEYHRRAVPRLPSAPASALGVQRRSRRPSAASMLARAVACSRVRAPLQAPPRPHRPPLPAPPAPPAPAPARAGTAGAGWAVPLSACVGYAGLCRRARARGAAAAAGGRLDGRGARALAPAAAALPRARRPGRRRRGVGARRCGRRRRGRAARLHDARAPRPGEPARLPHRALLADARHAARTEGRGRGRRVSAARARRSSPISDFFSSGASASATASHDFFSSPASGARGRLLGRPRAKTPHARLRPPPRLIMRAPPRTQTHLHK